MFHVLQKQNKQTQEKTIAQICRHDPRDIGCNRETCDKSFFNELVTCAV